MNTQDATKPSVIEQEWLKFKETCLEKNIPPELIGALRQCFYTGCHTLYAIAVVGLPEDEKEALVRLKEVHDALMANIVETAIGAGAAQELLAEIVKFINKGMTPRTGSPNCH
jgi:hypothetical protein